MIRRWGWGALMVALTLASWGTASGQAESVAGRLLASAERFVEQGDLQAALDQLSELLERFPAGEWVGDALLRTAELQRDLGRYEEATDVAERLAAEFAGSAAGAGGEVLAAEIQIAQAIGPDSLAAPRDRLRQIPVVYPADAFPDLRWRARALVRLGELASRTGDHAAAAAAYVRALEDEPVSPWTSQAAVGFAEALLREGTWPAAADLLQGVVEGDETLGGEMIAEETRTRAAGTLALLYRFHVAPAAGAPSWVRTERLRVQGTPLDRPKGITLAPDGSFLLVDEGVPLVGMFDPDGNLQRSLPLSGAELPFWSGDGTAYFVNRRSILRIVTSQRLTFVAERDPVEDIRAAYVDAVGRWYLLDTDDDRVTEYAPDRSYIRTALTDRDREPVDITGRGTGELFVLDRDQNEVIRRAPGETTWSVVARGNWSRPTALALDLIGNIYVLDEDDRQIHIYSPAGEQMHRIGPSLPGGMELDDPRDISIDGAGRIFVADRGQGTVWVIQ